MVCWYCYYLNYKNKRNVEYEKTIMIHFLLNLIGNKFNFLSVIKLHQLWLQPLHFGFQEQELFASNQIQYLHFSLICLCKIICCIISSKCKKKAAFSTSTSFFPFFIVFFHFLINSEKVFNLSQKTNLEQVIDQ